MNFNKNKGQVSRQKRGRTRTKTSDSMVNPILENEFDSVMSKIMDPIQFKRQKILNNQLKNEKKELLTKNFDSADLVRHQEVEYRTKDKLQINSNYALVGYLGELKRTEINVKLEAKRMNYLNKDKQWLIDFIT
jgi:hypothetical protein